jgi:hypothetical protein
MIFFFSPWKCCLSLSGMEEITKTKQKNPKKNKKKKTKKTEKKKKTNHLPCPKIPPPPPSHPIQREKIKMQ